jgi:hypothetical protein
MQGTEGVAPQGGDRGSSIQSVAHPAFAANVEPDGETAVLGLAGELDLSNVGRRRWRWQSLSSNRGRAAWWSI